MKLQSAVFATLLVFAGVGGAAPPTTVKAVYDVHRDGLHVAVVSESFEKNVNNYQILSESNPAGLLAIFVRTRIKVVSSGTISNSGLRPDQFEYGRLDDASKNVSARFDWKSDQLHLSYDGHNETIALPRDTQDRVSLMYQFMYLPAEQFGNLTFHMTNGKKVEAYRYQSAGSETITTPIGKLNTIHLIKQRDPGENGVEVWLSPEHHHLAIKVLITENDGSKYEQMITRLETK